MIHNRETNSLCNEKYQNCMDLSKKNTNDEYRVIVVLHIITFIEDEEDFKEATILTGAKFG